MTDEIDRSQAALAAIPAAAFFCMYTYEAGRYDYLDIPREFIEIPLSRMPILLSDMFFCLCLWFILALFAIHLEKSDKKWTKWIGNALLIGLLFGPFLFFFHPSWAGLAIAILACIGIAIDPRNIRGTPEHKAATDTSSYSDEQKRMQSIGIFLFLVIFFSLTLFSAGRALQSKQSSYIELDGFPNYVIVGQYSGNFVAKQYNPLTHKLLTGTILIPADDNKPRVAHEVLLTLKQ